MAAPSAQRLQSLAGETGYQPGTLEKVLRLLDLLQEIARDFTAYEREFLDGVLDRGELVSELLDAAPELRARIQSMPMLTWKTFHVRKHLGLSK